MLGLDFNRQRASTNGVHGMHGMNGTTAPAMNMMEAKPSRRFIAPVNECEFTLQSVLEEVPTGSAPRKIVSEGSARCGRWARR